MYEEQYIDLCKNILKNGYDTRDRTGTGTLSIFGATLKHNLQEGFPLLTTKKINFNLIVGELLWFLSGKTDLPSLRKYQNKEEDSHTIWDDDFNKFWDISDNRVFKNTQSGGRIYGEQLRNFNTGDVSLHVDQLSVLISNIIKVKKNPNHPTARRLICSFWNPYDHLLGDKQWCALPACHTDFQCLVRDNKLNLRFSMRSNDIFLGNPFNMASYGLLCHILAKLTGLEAGELLYFGTDVHIYKNHIEQVNEQIKRNIKICPTLKLPEFSTLDELLDLTGEDFIIENYDPHPFIKAAQSS
jgi:thymidylate synthase